MCPNGCGPRYFPKSWNKSLSKYHLEACNQHDSDYAQGGTGWDRTKADWKFARNMRRTSRGLWKVDKKSAILSLLCATIFYPVVRHFGVVSFKYKR